MHEELLPWQSLLPEGDIDRIPKGLYGVYILWCPLDYRSIDVQQKYAATVVNDWIPFYVGYGQRTRPFDHLTENTVNPHKLALLGKLAAHEVQPRITLAFATDLLERAYWVEKFIIASIGRTDLETGPLTNMKDGGADGGGVLGPQSLKKLSETHQRRSKTKKGRKQLRALWKSAHTPAANAKNAEQKRQFSQTAEGKAHLQKAFEASQTPAAREKSAEGKRRWAKTKEGRKTMAEIRAKSTTPEAIAKRAAAQRRIPIEEHDRIRERLRQGETGSALANEYGVSDKTISNIKHNKIGYVVPGCLSVELPHDSAPPMLTVQGTLDTDMTKTYNLIRAVKGQSHFHRRRSERTEPAVKARSRV